MQWFVPHFLSTIQSIDAKPNMEANIFAILAVHLSNVIGPQRQHIP